MIHDAEPLKKTINKTVSVFSFSLSLSTQSRKEGNESDGNPHRDVSRNVRSHDKIVDARLISSWTLHPEGVEIGIYHGARWTRCKREREILVSCSLERKICRSLLNETG